MADKKINQLDGANGIAPDDLFVICQDMVTGKAVSIPAQDVKAFMLGGTTAGARIYFTVGVPSNTLGVDGDVVFDKQGKGIYLKASGTWVLQDTYGNITTGKIRFTSAYGSDGLSIDGQSYDNADLINCDVISIRVETNELISTEEPEDIPAFDEYAFNPVTGIATFGTAIPEGYRITIIYTLL